MVNDTFPVNQSINKNTKLISIKFDRKEKIYKYQEIGVFSEPAKFKSPCEIVCLSRIPGFQIVESLELPLNF
jgi:hypothetical protein